MCYLCLYSTSMTIYLSRSRAEVEDSESNIKVGDNFNIPFLSQSASDNGIASPKIAFPLERDTFLSEYAGFKNPFSNTSEMSFHRDSHDVPEALILDQMVSAIPIDLQPGSQLRLFRNQQEPDLSIETLKAERSRLESAAEVVGVHFKRRLDTHVFQRENSDGKKTIDKLIIRDLIRPIYREDLAEVIPDIVKYADLSFEHMVNHPFGSLSGYSNEREEKVQKNIIRRMIRAGWIPFLEEYAVKFLSEEMTFKARRTRRPQERAHMLKAFNRLRNHVAGDLVFLKQMPDSDYDSPSFVALAVEVKALNDSASGGSSKSQLKLLGLQRYRYGNAMKKLLNPLYVPCVYGIGVYGLHSLLDDEYNFFLLPDEDLPSWFLLTLPPEWLRGHTSMHMKTD